MPLVRRIALSAMRGRVCNDRWRRLAKPANVNKGMFAGVSSQIDRPAVRIRSEGSLDRAVMDEW